MSRTLTLGCICDPISKQLAGIISQEDANQLDRDNNAINHCYVLGYMPDAVVAKARKKLMAKCQKAVTAHAQVNTQGQPRPTERQQSQ